MSNPHRVSEPRSRERRSLIVLLTVLALLTVGCSGSDATSANLVPVDTPAPGVLYVSTEGGAIQVVDAAAGTGTVLINATGDGQGNVVDIAPAPSAQGLFALVQDPTQTFKIDVAQVAGSSLEPVAMESDTLTCLDPHPAASNLIVHDALPGGATGAQFVPVAVQGPDARNADLELVSVACPRWTSDRAMVATARPETPTDPSTIMTVVQGSAGEQHEIAFTGCGTTPTSFTPDDAFLVISLTCYSGEWDDSGLYLVPVSDLAEPGDLDALTKLGDGLFGRTSWHPDGDWVAAVHADAIERQNIAQDLRAQPVGLQLIEVATLQTIDLELADDADPFSIAWLGSALDS